MSNYNSGNDLTMQLIEQISQLRQRVDRLEILERPALSTGAWTDKPVNPINRERYFATDRSIEYFYDVTNARWVSNLVTVPFIQRAAQPFAQGAQTFEATFPYPYFTYGGTLVESIQCSFIPLSVAQSITNYYQLAASSINQAGVVTALTLSNITNTQLAPLGLWYGFAATNGSVRGTNTAHIEISMAPVGNPGTYLFYGNLALRFVG
jgi:hypothetical protein